MRLSIYAFFCILIVFPFSSLNSSVVFAQTEGSPPLEVGKLVERELKGGESHTYELKLATGEFLEAVANQRGINIFVILTGPDGEKLAEVGSPRGWRGAQTLLYITQTSGIYKLGIVSPDKDAATGSYRLTIAELRPGTSKDAADVSALKIYYETHSYMTQFMSKPPEEKSAEMFSALTAKFGEALELFRKAENQEFEIHTLNVLALSHARFGNVSQAIEYWKQTLDMNERLGKGVDLNQITNMGMAYKQMRNYAEAIKLYERGYDNFDKTGNDYAKMVTLYILGNTFRDQGDPEVALEYYLRSLRLAEKMPDPTKFIQAWHETGSAYSILGNYARALEYQQKALAMYESIGNQGGVAGMFVNIGVNYEAQYNLELALEYFQKALNAFEKIDNGEGGQGTALLGMSEISRKKGNYAGALMHLDRALKLFEEMKWKQRIAETLDLIGRVHLDKGDNSRALNHFKEALEISETLPNKLVAAEILNDLSNLYIQEGNYAAALDYAERTAEIADQTGASGFLWQSHVIKGKAYLGLKQYAQARQAFDRSIEIIEDLRLQTAGGEQEQQNFFQNKTVAYFESMRLLINEGKSNESFAFSERAKSRVLLDVLQTGRAEPSKVMTVQEKERERILKIELVSLNTQILSEKEKVQADLERLRNLQDELEKKRLEFEGFQTNLYAAHPKLRVQRGEMQSVSLKEAAEMLPDTNSAFLEFAVSDDKTFLFVITGDAGKKVSLKVYPVEIERKDLSARTEDFRTKLANGDLDFAKPAQDLYKLLLKPAEAQIKNKTNLVFVPDNTLWNLPFQALMDEKGKYIVEKAAISYAPSLTALREMKKRAAERKPSPDAELLAFGNPIVAKSTKERVQRVFMDETLEPIPEAERLVNELGRMYGPTRSKVFTGAAAREEVAKTEAPKYRIVQFATHGILNNASPMYSQLVMAQNEKDPNEDGLLEAWELKDLDLNADLVILTACETARGRIANGEGIIGMTWASFIAGAPTTVASQWKVESSSTTELMLEFHRQLRTGKVSKAEALRRASLKVMKMPKYRHPSYWAGFVLVGDGS